MNCQEFIFKLPLRPKTSLCHCYLVKAHYSCDIFSGGKKSVQEQVSTQTQKNYIQLFCNCLTFHKILPLIILSFNDPLASLAILLFLRRLHSMYCGFYYYWLYSHQSFFSIPYCNPFWKVLFFWVTSFGQDFHLLKKAFFCYFSKHHLLTRLAVSLDCVILDEHYFFLLRTCSWGFQEFINSWLHFHFPLCQLIILFP